MNKLQLFAFTILGMSLPAAALADDHMMVLQLDSSAADEVLAGLLTQALHESVTELPGWVAVSPELSVGGARALSGTCEDESDACIASLLADGDADYVLYGSLRRTDRQRDDGYLVSLYLLSQRTREIEGTVSTNVVPEQGVALRSRAQAYVDELIGTLPARHPALTPAWHPSAHAAERDLARQLEQAAQTRRRSRRIGWGLLALSGASFGAVMAIAPERRNRGALAPVLFGTSALAFGAAVGALLAGVNWQRERAPVSVTAGASPDGANVDAYVRF